MEKKPLKKKESAVDEAAIEELALKLGFTPDLLRSLVGNRIRGTATVARDGSFEFAPQRETGPRQEKIKETRQGSLVRSLPSAESNVYKLTVKSKPGSQDPAADLAEEAARLLRQMKSETKFPTLRGRTLLKTGQLNIRADLKTGQLSVLFTLTGEDLTGQLLAQVSEALKVMAANRQTISRLKKIETENN